MTTLRDICSDALRELRVTSIGDDSASEDAAAVLRAYNRMMAAFSNNGETFSYPSVTDWRGPWKAATTYNVGDGVSVGGRTYVCTANHTSSFDYEPGASYDGASNWTQTAYVPAALTDTFPLPVEFEEPVIALLARRISTAFGKDIASMPDLIERSDTARAMIAGYFARVKDAVVDNALIITPARRRPYVGPINPNS